MQVRRFPRVDDLADAVVNSLEAVVASNPNAVIGWPSGRTTVPILRSLAGREPRFSLAGVTVAMKLRDIAVRVIDTGAEPDQT